MDDIISSAKDIWAIQYVQAAVIVAFSIVASKLIDLLISTTITQLTRKTETKVDDEIIDNLHGPVVKTVVLIGLGLAAGHLGLDKAVTTTVVRVLMTFGLIVWTGFAFKSGKLLLRSAAEHPTRFKAISGTTYTLFDNMLKVLVIALVAYLLISVWDFDATGWLASAGIAGIAIGFAAKDTLSNLFAGVFIIGDGSYKVGDFIVLETGERGQVSQIGLRSTKMLTRDDIEITVPNSVLGTTKVINEAGGPHPKHRVRVKVGVAYGSDIDEVKRVLLDVAIKEPLVSVDPSPRVRFRALGDSSLDLELLGWIDEPVLRGRALDNLYTDVYKRLNEEGIEIPFPQRDLHLKEMPDKPVG